MLHPQGVEPWGNYFLSQTPDIRPTSLGNLAVFSDELLLELIQSLSAADLGRLSCVSKALYCFSYHDDVWKGLVLEDVESELTWAGCWRCTYLATRNIITHEHQHSKCLENAPAPKKAKKSKTKKRRTSHENSGDEHAGALHHCQSPVVVRGFYSDILNQGWFCGHIDVSPEWLEVDNIDRVSRISVADFRRLYEAPNRPVIISDGAGNWPALKKWTKQYLAQAFKGKKVIVGNYPMSFSTYLDYMSRHDDDMPLYLFDKTFLDTAPQLADDYAVPPYFQEDLFGVLGQNRPDYRWLIMGPNRSGSSFHIDPNATCAWNAVISGSKRWVLYPPGTTPPGVHPSADGADVATPVSIMEWYLNFYAATKEGKVKPIECTCRAGEVLFVPRGWWHQVLNLEEGVAITQNYVSTQPGQLAAVLAFLAPGKKELVSGCSVEDRCSLHDRFMDALSCQRPDVLAQLEQHRKVRQAAADKQHQLAALFKTGPTVVDEGVSEKTAPSKEATSTSFSFGFQVAAGSGGESSVATGASNQAPGMQSTGFSFGFKF